MDGRVSPWGGTSHKTGKETMQEFIFKGSVPVKKLAKGGEAE
jgi:hypothetical protein